MLLSSFVIVTIFYQSVGQNIPVTPFNPAPICITVNDLPPPYNASSADKPSHVIPPPKNPSLFAPDKFTVSIYQDKLASPRYLQNTPTGNLLVTGENGNKITLLIDSNRDGSVDESTVFADKSNGLNSCFGMAFNDGYFYLANAGDLRRYRYEDGKKKIEGTGRVLMTYPSTYHWTRTVIIPPWKDHLFVSVGSGSNVDIEPLPHASIQSANFDGSNNQTFVFGTRNPVGLAFHPITKDFYGVVQGRDELGDDLVPDYFTKINQGDYYGWPFAYLSSKNIDPRHTFSNGSSQRPDLVNKTKTPDVLFQAHSAVLGMQFYTGQMFPQRYQNGAFAAFHGSWNRNSGTGYKIVFIPFGDDNRPTGCYEDFLYGFLTKPEIPETWEDQ
ncbi:unnamed protein product [Didymodactylos carnosus]|uniref:Pyrroloquinoline quinone-dependent pyranose dehydrogenase beta-propeller domain-containing protein n=1 Tax=Didymodactylos carnosus TaxID=1234261 RepID=A0A814MHA7_9BILA|nr:unnamed protein product [Didymodactylos carnosus]CAF3844733.1 unnamed protein product [Didymodactylos carnosus]